MEPHKWVAGDERVRLEPPVAARVMDDEQFGAFDGMRAERDGSRSLLRIGAVARLEPLPLSSISDTRAIGAPNMRAAFVTISNFGSLGVSRMP